jgi:hypothetical protein
VRTVPGLSASIELERSTHDGGVARPRQEAIGRAAACGRSGVRNEAPADCTHAEHVDPEGVALLSGRRRNGVRLSKATCAGKASRSFMAGRSPTLQKTCTHTIFDVRIMVLGGEITVTRDGKPETFSAGDHCELPVGCQHTTKVGPEGVAYIVGKAYRRAAAA